MASDPLEELTRLAINEQAAIDRVLIGFELPLLDARTSALVRIAALLALDPAETSLQAALEAAYAAGVEREEILEIARALEPTIGRERVETAVLLITGP